MILNALLALSLVLAATAMVVTNRSSTLVEATVRRYASAISGDDLDGALAEITPNGRAAYREFVSNQVGKDYRITVVAVHSHSIIDRLFHGVGSQPSDVTIVLDIDRNDPEAHYRPTTRVLVEEHAGQWYLSTPLLEPEAEASQQ